MWIVEHLFLDSLLFLRLLPEGVGRVADLGSGAGVPGIPLKIVKPDLTVTLIESRARRVSFLRAVIRELKIERIEVVAGRVGPGHAGLARSFDAVVARCAGNLPDVIETGRALLRPGGRLLVAGPPRATTLPPGARWVEVPGTTPGARRRFAVLE